MNAIVGIAELLAKTALSPEQNKYVTIFRRAGDNLLNLINDILDLSRVEDSHLELELIGFSLTDLLAKVSELMEFRAREKGLGLVIEFASDLPIDLIGDPARLRQILLNLIGNAIKFTESGQVILRVMRERDASAPPSLRFTVSDTGIGIPDEKLAQMFERFTQADSSTSRRFGGSGLGLPISKRLVELMGGRIWAERGIAVGSVFSFVVPFTTPSKVDPSAVKPIETDHHEAPLPALRILLVEDSTDNGIITLAYLEHTPCKIDIAENGAIACEMFKAGHYDLVLMDRQMPVMDGLTATREIRAWEQANSRSPVPIIALTAYALKGERDVCLAAGCTEFLTKPIRQEVLLRAIRDHSGGTTDQGRGTDAILRALTDRIPSYLQKCRHNTVAMQDALDQVDFKTVEILGHQMMGSGASYGFQAITDIGAGLEQAAGSADSDASRKWVSELSSYLNRVEIVPRIADHPGPLNRGFTMDANPPSRPLS
jgi:CheY-like chemotaxis protein/anti-sigma regulatory factor (Ser/Thr protein kinase)